MVKKIHVQYRRPGFNSWVGKIPWRREWQPTPVFLPGEFRGQRSLVGYSPWGHKESDMTEGLTPTAHVLYGRAVDLLILHTQTSCLLTNVFPFPSLRPLPDLLCSMSLIILDSLISGFMQYLHFYVWRISLSITPSRFIHVVIIQMSGFSSLLRINNIPPCVLSIQPHFLYASVRAHLLKADRHLMQPHPLCNCHSHLSQKRVYSCKARNHLQKCSMSHASRESLRRRASVSL